MIRDDATQSGRSRAQTAQDFAVGIGLFLIAVAFVFTFVPDIVDPYAAGAGGSEAAQADRAATMIVGNMSVEGRPNELDADRRDRYFEEVADTSDEAAELRNRTGLSFAARVNVTLSNVRAPDGDYVNSSGIRYPDGVGGRSATRIVRTDDPTSCVPACRLVVRVW